ncbi:LuxR C-terminal-related transcriptional regulator [Saccharopolyspora indica]|uniref:helix-turn-helix transcriptional regulator n=1 Tax=Saccharopolyspora indica TaxID=1229659 RepID=UPI0022EA883E|nr:LuxR C-terminal-related transcriptional regulator [Saccharopolyspora indica]MDA3647210.1 LuxR C-terminal-related transcriptional regulator [Saccharopolyspora indica]
MTTAFPTDRRPRPARGIDPLLAAARSEVLLMSTQTVMAPSPLGVLRRVNFENLRRGVRYRVLVPDPVRTAPVLALHLAKLARAGADVRTVPEVSANALFVDRATAVFPAGHADSGPAADLAMIRLPDVVATSIELFELRWSAAVPLLPSDLPDTAELEFRERRLLSLLSLGYTDAAAADELDISVRTVRRMVSGIMNRLGARSRFMAGAKAAERGWLLGEAA